MSNKNSTLDFISVEDAKKQLRLRKQYPDWDEYSKATGYFEDPYSWDVCVIEAFAVLHYDPADVIDCLYCDDWTPAEVYQIMKDAGATHLGDRSQGGGKVGIKGVTRRIYDEKKPQSATELWQAVIAEFSEFGIDILPSIHTVTSHYQEYKRENK